ncbi:tail length tape-measure protein [Aeromonas phage AhyVDH1]|nr:tail length tape-measure protein [Aeromonas phage AhyVDH1]
MANRNERLQFILDMVDKVTAPSAKVTKSLQGLGQDVTATQKKLATLNKQAGDISKLSAMRGELDRNTKTSKELADKVGSLRVQMALTEKPTKAMRDNLRAAVKEQKAHEAASDKHKDALAKLTQNLNRAGVDTNRLGEATRRNRQDVAAATAALRTQTSELDRATKKQEQLTKARENYAKTEERINKAQAIGAKAALAGVALGGAVIAAGAPNYGFQKQMSAVQAIGDFSQQDKARLTASARQEAAVSSFGAVEAGQAQAYLAAAGFKVDQIEKSLKGVLNLASATETGLAETADISSNILSGFGFAADQMGRVGDVLTATTSGHNVNLQMLGESMKYVAPIAKQTNQSIESISAMVGLLGDVGIQGSMAGTALKGAMLRLSGPTRDAQKAFDQLNVSTKDANGNVRALPEILSELQNKMAGMGSGDKLALLKRMFGEEPAAAIATLLDKAGATIDEKTKRLMNSAGAADRAAAARLDNLWGDVENFKSSLEETQIQFGGILDKAMRGLVRIGIKGVDAFTKWQKENPKMAKSLALIAAAVSVLLTVSGTLIVVLGTLWLMYAKTRLAMFLFNTMVWAGVKAIGAKTLALLGWIARMTVMVAWFTISRTAMVAWRVAMVALRGIMVAVTAAQWLFNAALTANPIGAVIMAVVALVAAGVWLYQNWDRLPELFDRLWVKVKEFIGFDPLEMIKGAWDGVWTYFSGLFDKIWGKFQETFGGMIDGVKGAANWALGGFGMFGDNPELAEQVKDAPKAGSSDPAVNGKPATKGNQIKAPAQVSNSYKTEAKITIHATPGMSAEEVGREVARQLDERDRRKAQQQRGSYID